LNALTDKVDALSGIIDKVDTMMEALSVLIEDKFSADIEEGKVEESEISDEEVAAELASVLAELEAIEE